MTNKVEPLKEPGEAPALNLEEYYEKEIVKKRHNCTDIICLILFLIFIIVQGILSVIIFINGGDPKNLILPHDSDGNLCTDSTPNLFYFNLVECLSINAMITGCSSPTKCVATCPADNYYYQIDSHRKILLGSYCIQSKLSTYFSGSVPATTDAATYLKLINSKICPIYTVSSGPIYSYCLPSFLSAIANSTQSVMASDSATNTTMSISDLSQGITPDLLSKGTKYVLSLLNIKTIAQSIMEDFVSAAVLIVILLIIAAIVTFIYIFILRWVLAPFIYMTLIGIVGALAFAVYYCIMKYLTLKDNASSTSSFELSSDVNYYLSLGYTWLAIGIVAGVILLIVLLLILVLIKRLRLAIQIICEASKAISSVFMTLVFPVIPLLLQVGFLAYFIVTAVILACSGKALYKVANNTYANSNLSSMSSSSLNVGDSCSPNSNDIGSSAVCVFYKYGFDTQSVYNSVMGFLSTYQFVPQLYNVFMLFWVQAFVIGFNQMVLAGSFGIWYWSQDKARCILLTSVKDTLIYHMGSIAFGSLLIAICKFLRFILTLVEKRIKSATGNNKKINCIISFLMCCCKCCLWCLEKFIKFINRNAYIMVAIYGRNFCASAKDALMLLIKNPLRALVLDRVTEFILFLGKLLITTGVGVLAFYFFSKGFTIDANFKKYFAPDLHYYWVPLIAVIIGTFIIAKIFFTVFEMAVDTIFLCAMKDLDIHDGSAEKPYYMSAKLLKILNVKNKEPEPVPVVEDVADDPPKAHPEGNVVQVPPHPEKF